MPWFKIDDTLAHHAKVMAAGNAAMGLWVRAGSYCAQQLTDGFVSEEALATLGTRSQAARLVAAGLWDAAEGGYYFHDWAEYQPTKSDVLAERRAAKERQARWRANRRRNGVTDTVTNGVTNTVSHNGSHAVTNAAPGDGAPTRPDPTISPLTPRSHAAQLLGWPEDDERLDHLQAYLAANNVRSPRAWLTRCHDTGDLEPNLTAYAHQQADPYAHLPWINAEPPEDPA